MFVSRIGLGLAAIMVAGLAVVPVTAYAAADDDPARWVNPFVGTKPGGADHGTGGGAGNTFPGAVAPFGMVQWSPDTVTPQPGGYYYDDNRIKGFSLTHLSGAGCSTYQDVPFMPFAGEVTTSPGDRPRPVRRPRSRTPTSRRAPGRYDGRAGLAARRSSWPRPSAPASARFDYPAGAARRCWSTRPARSTGTDDAEITIGKDSISGWATSGRFCGVEHSYRVYFHAKFDQPFASVGTWKNGAVTPGRTAETRWRDAEGGSQRRRA